MRLVVPIMLALPFFCTAMLASMHVAPWWVAALLGLTMDMVIVWSLSDGWAR